MYFFSKFSWAHPHMHIAFWFIHLGFSSWTSWNAWFQNGKWNLLQPSNNLLYWCLQESAGISGSQRRPEQWYFKVQRYCSTLQQSVLNPKMMDLILVIIGSEWCRDMLALIWYTSLCDLVPNFNFFWSQVIVIPSLVWCSYIFPVSWPVSIFFYSNCYDVISFP